MVTKASDRARLVMKKKTAPTAKCPLCLQVAVLQESHLLPAAVYKHLRDPRARNPHHVLFSNSGEGQSSRQAQQYLLCSRCEQRFNRIGEDWTLAHSARRGNSFRLRDILHAHKGSKLVEGVDCFYCADIPTMNTDALCYFALSVIWRASVCSWSIDGMKLAQIELAKYSEPTRLFLNGDAGFPANTVVTVVVSSLPEVHLMATMPQTKKCEGYTSHFFSIPGLDFTVDIGARIPAMLQEACLYRGLRRPIFYSAAADLETAGAYARLRLGRERQIL
jgi:hypothetical protein